MYIKVGLVEVYVNSTHDTSASSKFRGVLYFKFAKTFGIYEA